MILSSGLWNLTGSMTGPFFSLYVQELGGRRIAFNFDAHKIF